MKRYSSAGSPLDQSGDLESSASAVSWAAILGGGVVAAAITVTLLALGSGLGFASMSPYPNSGATLKSAAVMAGIWLIIVQWVASGFGGYITGRLRIKWVEVHADEVFFRDTAHGFLMWATASVAIVVVVGSGVSSVIAGGAKMATAVAGGAAAGAGQGAMQSAPSGSSSTAFDVDTLLRADPANAASAGAGANGQDTRGETARILASGIGGEIAPDDKVYLAQLVAARTGISQADAQKRVDDVIAKEKAAEVKARQVADETRKAATSLSIFTFLSMVIGAFIASVAAAYGGKLRDEF